MSKMQSFCYRCEHRALFHETGHGPRFECGVVDSAVVGCYMYKPILPVLMVKAQNDDRPQFAGAMLSARSRAGDLLDARLKAFETVKGTTAVYWSPKALDQAHLKARDSLAFLNDHPAMGRDANRLLYFDIMEVDSRGHAEPYKGLWDLYYTPRNYKRFKAAFDKEFKDYSKDELDMKSLISIKVPYKELYGEDWTYDHIEYWGELCFVMWDGKNSDYDPRNWGPCAAVDAGGRSYEDMIVNITAEFKKHFGNFKDEKFLTPEEKENHKKVHPFIYKPMKGSTNTQLLSNKKYMHVGPGTLNHRWLKWFMKTPYGSRWDDSIKEALKGKRAKNV